MDRRADKRVVVADLLARENFLARLDERIASGSGMLKQRDEHLGRRWDNFNTRIGRQGLSPRRMQPTCESPRTGQIG